jgi:ribonuclease HI
MSKKKIYAVAKGSRPGLYDEWFGRNGAEVQVRGFAGAVYKGFTSREEAEAWFTKLSTESPAIQQTMPFAPFENPVAREKACRRPKPVIKELPEHCAGASGEQVVIYTDGGCRMNPGPGGYGVVLLQGNRRNELSGGFARTTNNRMELTACIKGLQALEQRSSVTVYSDSQYVVNGMEKGWARRWQRNNWKRNKNETAENSDLWSQLLDVCEKHEVRFSWVRGHNGNRENERCDTLAVEMTRRDDLPPDHGYGNKSGPLD